MRRLLLLLILCAPLAGVAQNPASQAQALFERDWQWRLQQQPELATSLGDHRYDDRLQDASPAACQSAVDHEREMLAAARAIDRARLGPQDRLSYDLFVDARERALALAAFTPCDPYPLTFLSGLPQRLPQLVAQLPFGSADDYRRYLARLAALPGHVDGLIARLRAGQQSGWSAPKAAVQAVPDQLRALREHLADGPLAAPLQALPATIDADARAQLARDGAALLEGAVAPALRKLEDYLRADYLPAARSAIAASALPGGQAWYAALVRATTGTSLTPAQVHALGLQEVARLQGQMKEVIARTGFRGSFAEFAAFARSDPRLFPRDADALLARYRRTVARAASRMDELFASVPAAELVVKPLAAGDAARQLAAYYDAGSPGRVAALVVNTSAPDTRPLWEVDTIALHEGLPGHHAQAARALELDGLPAFRRHAWYPAFGEGWALYAESLGPRIGLLTESFTAFGQRNSELFRAARLVVDTGIHAQGWSRQQAIDYLNANTANPPADNALEVDRYIAQPAQALSYKLGQLAILGLRDAAQARLGHGFDIRRFHNAVIDQGPLPLPLLEREVRRWIEAEAAAQAQAGPD